MRRLLFLAVLMLCAGTLHAQRSAVPPLGMPIPPLAPIPPMGTMSLSVPGNTGFSIPPSGVCCPPFATHRARFPRSFLGFFPPFLGGFFSSETVYVPVVSEPPSTSRPVETTTPPPEPSEPLLIEREGDRFVRYGGAPAKSRTSSQGTVKSLADYHASAQAGSVAAESPPVILVFRDTHRQEVAQYLISGPVLYAYAAGQELRVPLAELDIAATLLLNRQRGVAFLLPSAQNEVVISF